MGGQNSKVTGGHWSAPGKTRTSSLGAARPLPPSADIGPGGQSVGQAAQFCLAPLLLALRRTASLAGFFVLTHVFDGQTPSCLCVRQQLLGL